MQTKIINILREVERLDLKCEIVMVIDILRVTSTITNALKKKCSRVIQATIVIRTGIHSDHGNTLPLTFKYYLWRMK